MIYEKRKNSNLIIIILIGLIFFIIGFFGGKFVKNNINNSPNNNSSNKQVSSKKINKNKEENLDINSRLVRGLYEKVAPSFFDSEECFFGWNYNLNSNETTNDFYADKGPESIKMSIVFGNLNSLRTKNVECDANIPDIKDNYKSVCYMNKTVNSFNTPEIAYSKDYVERVYKDIFGRDAVLDTSVSFTDSAVGVDRYYYIPALDEYVLYFLEGGGTCGGSYGKEELTKAAKSNKEIKIFAKQTFVIANDNGFVTDNNNVEKNTNIVYTFELEDDGMYKFVSRVKEAN